VVRADAAVEAEEDNVTSSARTLGIIGGSGLYEIEGLEDIEELHASTTFGEPSDHVHSGRLGDTTLLFLPRHGRGHRLPPHRVNYRANILALKELGAEQIVSVSAVGSMKDDIHPGDVVVVDQFIDRTRSRPTTFFEDRGIVVHVGFSDPVDAALSKALGEAAKSAGARVHQGGTYLCIEGPQFSSRAESNLYRSWGVDVIGMTNMPEARLAREAELPYASMALVTDYDCWHDTEDSVSVQSVVEVLKKNVVTAKEVLRALSPSLPDPSESPAVRALEGAILTSQDRIPSEIRYSLGSILGKYLPDV
jgi:5'-methylthioadenosine phosphorylase